ncbi:hypothetical protein QQ008_19275 [Fulvivirgaceae bacterium BMA10]|uniref:Transporter n=1 Tax=Splendidivirga corallicola TaxID=3051826 RepID=A0ABT8KV85_9BACT|nr:hypothetical protein [Fulvivirgaceae bacterium BMA10]
MQKLSYLLFSVFTFLSLTANAQSPWTQKKGEGYFQLSYTTIADYSALFLADGGSWRLSRPVSDITLSFYGEYGLSDDITILTSVPFKLLETGNELVQNPSIAVPTIGAGNLNTLGNLQVGVRKNFVNKNFILSGQIKAELPTGSFDAATGLRSGLDALSIIPSVSIGKGWTDYYGYINVGTSIRTNDYSGDLIIGGELGAHVLDRLWLIAVLDIIENFENGNVQEDSRNLETGLYVNNQEFLAYGFKGIVEITDNFGVNVAFYGASSGNFVARRASTNFGAYFKLK